MQSVLSFTEDFIQRWQQAQEEVFQRSIAAPIDVGSHRRRARSCPQDSAPTPLNQRQGEVVCCSEVRVDVAHESTAQVLIGRQRAKWRLWWRAARKLCAECASL